MRSWCITDDQSSGLEDILNIKFYTENDGFILTKNKIYRTTDGCKSWDIIRTKASNDFLKFFPIDTKKMYVVSKSGELIKTMDGGNNWIDFGKIGEGSITEIFFLNDTIGYAVGVNNIYGIFLGGSYDSVFLFKTEKGGNVWTKNYIDLPPVYALYFKNESTGWAGGTIVSTSSSMLAFTSDSGKNWIRNEDRNLLQGDIRKILFTNNEVGWALGWDANNCSKSTDKGKTWHRFQISNLLGGSGYNQDIVSCGDEIIICKFWGMFHSYDNGETFIRDSLFDKIEILSLSLNNTAGGYAAGKTGAIWKYQKQSVDIHFENDLPLINYLFQNYPNPFNPTTKIKYSLTSEGFVTLKVFDILGREIKILVSENKKQGNYEVNFDASSVAGGIYFYKLQVNDYIESKKMIFAK